VTRRTAPASGAPGSRSAFSALFLARRLRELAGPVRGMRLCVAFSGGLDSTALLCACAALRARYRCHVRAIHINHHLQPAAGSMARSARRAARSLKVPCRVINAPVRAGRGESIEAAARTHRYDALRRDLQSGEWLLLAHHQEDQAESLLLQLLRGAGIAGLAAMPARSGVTLRPLLHVPRARLFDYLRARRTQWSEDPSNADERFDRNFLRRRILPLLRERWPGLEAAVSRTAGLAAEAQELLMLRAASQLAGAQDGVALSVSVIRRLSDADRRNALRYWLGLRGLGMPDARRLREIAGPMLEARHDALPQVRWPGGVLRRHGDLLYAARPETGSEAGRASKPVSWNWRRAPRVELPGGGSLELIEDPNGELRSASLPARLTVAFRRADGSVAGLPGGRTLKRALQEGPLPPWERARVPLIYAGRRLLAVGDWWRAPECSAAHGARTVKRCRLRWRTGESGVRI